MDFFLKLNSSFSHVQNALDQMQRLIKIIKSSQKIPCKIFKFIRKIIKTKTRTQILSICLNNKNLFGIKLYRFLNKILKNIVRFALIKTWTVKLHVDISFILFALHNGYKKTLHVRFVKINPLTTWMLFVKNVSNMKRNITLKLIKT